MARHGLNHVYDANHNSLDLYYGESLITAIPIERQPPEHYNGTGGRLPQWRQDKLVAEYLTWLFDRVAQLDLD